MSEHKGKVKKLWFKAKEYGWGWYPVSWQGWALTAVFAALYAISFVLFFGWAGSATEAHANTQTSVLGILEFLIWIAFLTYLLIRICTKYGEKPGWRWGRKK